ncbi:unnamed protein product [Orchesella dallaii]|uniref:Zonadhesin n=1 Tax=Orchesella dallaii TaxID=48710 RepID=A0ABP1QTT3_9HEXA
MKRLLKYLCLSLFIIVLNISNSSCYNETSSFNKSDDEHNNNSGTSYKTPLIDNAENHAKSTISDLEIDKAAASTEATKFTESVATTTAAPNLEIQSSFTSAVRPTEATTPVPTTESYNGTESFDYSNSDSTESPQFFKAKTDIPLPDDAQTSVPSNKTLGDPIVGEKLNNAEAETQLEGVLQSNIQPKATTTKQPIRIGKVEHINVNTTSVPAMKIPIPIVIDYEGQSSDIDSTVYNKQDFSVLQDKEKTIKNDTNNHSHLAASDKELPPKENETSISASEIEPEEVSKPFTKTPHLPPTVPTPTVSTFESSIVIPASVTTKDNVTPFTFTQKLEPVSVSETEANEDTTFTFTSTHSTISPSTASTPATATIEVFHDAHSESKVNSSIRISSETETNNNQQMNISVTSTPPQITATPVSIDNHTSFTLAPTPTLGTSTPPPRNETEPCENEDNPIYQFLWNLRSHIILCVISLLIILLTVSVVCSFILAFWLLLKLLWKMLVSGCGRAMNCYIKRKDSSRNTYEEGSLFPRCDVAVRPYLASDHDMY